MRVRTIASLFFVVMLGVVLGTPKGYAACDIPPAKVVWFSPAAGAVDVSIHAPVMVLGSWGSSVRVLVDNQELDVIEPGLWRFGTNTPLTVNTTYTLTVIATGEDNTEDIQTASFQTEAESKEPQGAPIQPEPSTWDAYASWDHLSPLCQEALQAAACFEGDEATLLTLNTTYEGATAWVVEPIGPNNELGTRHLWPAICGPPSVRAAAATLADSETCYSLKAVGHQGILAQFTKRCGPFITLDPSEDIADGTSPDAGSSSTSSGGCRTTPGTGPATTFGLGLVLLLAWCVRRKMSHGEV